MKRRMAALLCAIGLLLAAPALAQGEGTPVGVSDEARYNINLFLSNFSEQGLTKFGADAADAELAEFAALHIRINRRRYVEPSDKAGYTCRISEAYIGEIAMEYVGRQPQNPASASLPYENGYYYFEEGAPFDIGFVSMSAAEALGDGLFGIFFGCYGMNSGWENGDCRLRPEQAAQKYGNQAAVYTGYAVLSVPQGTLEGGREGWTLVSYTVE